MSEQNPESVKADKTEEVRGPSVGEAAPTAPADSFVDLPAEDWGALSPAGRLAVRRLQQCERRWATEMEKARQWAPLLAKAPDLLQRLIRMFEGRGAIDARTRSTSLWLHGGVLVVGTAAMVVLGVCQVLTAETVTAILGPLFTYVLVNLRNLTPGGRQSGASE